MLETSAVVKAAFKNAGIPVRVKDLGVKFVICMLNSGVIDQGKALAITSRLGFTDVCGASSGQFNGKREMICYKNGAVVRIHHQ